MKCTVLFITWEDASWSEKCGGTWVVQWPQGQRFWRFSSGLREKERWHEELPVSCVILQNVSIRAVYSSPAGTPTCFLGAESLATHFALEWSDRPSAEQSENMLAESGRSSAPQSCMCSTDDWLLDWAIFHCSQEEDYPGCCQTKESHFWLDQV